LPQYAKHLTDDGSIEEIMWRMMIWYYDQMGFVYVPSRATGDELVERGIGLHKILVYPRGVDTKRFNPGNRNGVFDKSEPLRSSVKLLYVGRVSKEKNLPQLANAFRRLAQEAGEVLLVVVGDGPYLPEMQEILKDCPCTFSGFKSGAELDTIYASSDLFVFPSTTDTFSNVVLEAQASGIPVIVTDQGGPKENLIDGETGVIVVGNNETALFNAMRDLACNRARLDAMGKAARRYAETRSFESAFLRTWDLLTAAPQPAEAPLHPSFIPATLTGLV
jgi:glycosyltransferase involved in cell wall biosynthesis